MKDFTKRLAFDEHELSKKNGFFSSEMYLNKFYRVAADKEREVQNSSERFDRHWTSRVGTLDLGHTKLWYQFQRMHYCTWGTLCRGTSTIATAWIERFLNCRQLAIWYRKWARWIRGTLSSGTRGTCIMVLGAHCLVVPVPEQHHGLSVFAIVGNGPYDVEHGLAGFGAHWVVVPGITACSSVLGAH